MFTLPAMAVSGAAWMLVTTLLNLGVQLPAPRWVTARALSLYQSALTGGIAAGAWFWGRIAGQHGVELALIASGAALVASPLLGFLLPLPHATAEGAELAEVGAEPDVALALTLKSGPVVIELDYEVEQANARLFYDAMQNLQKMRQRNGAFEWSLARSISDPEMWTERFLCPTWGDYLRLRSRFTHSDRAVQTDVTALVKPGAAYPIRRRLERPFGSVRWQAETPDPQNAPATPFTP
jgi:hypothetical protein